ncbi:MAG: hypothetical protein COA96_02975 [SAR86 cluster bacterium]|uniref:Fibronectin type-III domain-containing protein n=1 Tax=SAR86 cluster bacterium TaxID=2030880 RepID=A0A2A5B7C3_9GAMM|nr:MAG: hypothetical protein COA96_02975 [SAR86 cluster bacterium]
MSNTFGFNRIYVLPISKIIFLMAAVFCASNVMAQLSTPRLGVSNGRESLALSWSAVDGATGYTLYYAPFPYVGPDSVLSLDMGLEQSISGLLPEGASYYVAVEAYNEVETSNFSNVEYFILDNDYLSYQSSPGSFNGLTLIAPISSNTSYLIDDFGEVMHQWESTSSPKLSAYLLASGNLLRTGNVATGFFDSGGKGGAIEELDWDGNTVWNFEYSDEDKTLHHDIELLPNGNILALSWEDRGNIWAEVIVEIEKTGSDQGEVVWRWDIFDHLDELGLNSDSATTEDWIHLNSIDYNHASNQILVSSRSHDQIWLINKDDGSVAAISSVQLSGQHDAKWIDDKNAESNITVFDNGDSFSRALELNSAMNSVVFSYGNNDSEFFYSSRISSVQRLANNNTFICSGIDGLIIEIDSAGNKLREYVNAFGGNSPVGIQTDLFRAEKYPTGYTPYF